MGIATSCAGSFDIDVTARNNDSEQYEAVKEYSIDVTGVHLLTCHDEQHFIPLWNIRKLEIREHD